MASISSLARARRCHTSTRARTAVLGLALALLFACERAPDLAGQTRYEKDGLSFDLPGNWSVTDDLSNPDLPGFRVVFFESPGDAIGVIQRYQPAIDLSTEEFAAEFLSETLAAAEGFVDLGQVKPLTTTRGGAAPVSAIVAGRERSGVEQRFSVNVLGERVRHTSRTFRVDLDGGVLFVVVQAADEDWALVAPGFDLVLGSLDSR